MASYEGEEADAVIEPQLPDGKKKVVWIVHDECCFNSHDGKKGFGLKLIGSLFVRKDMESLSW
jgi:hypothetical protein